MVSSVIIDWGLALAAIGTLGICPPVALASRADRMLRVRSGRIEEAASTYGPQAFSRVVLNLVCQWLPNLDSAVGAVAEVTQLGGRVLVTLVPPEFSKNGHFSGRVVSGHWLIDKPVRRKPFLTMINRMVGPLWFFPRTTPEYLTTFAKFQLYCRRAEYIFIDSLLTDLEKETLFKERPLLERHREIPAFLAIEFEKLVGQ